MKRLLFAGLIFLYITALAQTKAGKIDTMAHAVFRPAPVMQEIVVAAKEQRATKQLKTSEQKISIRQVNRRRMNLSGKELMKYAVVNNGSL